MSHQKKPFEGTVGESFYRQFGLNVNWKYRKKGLKMKKPSDVIRTPGEQRRREDTMREKTRPKPTLPVAPWDE